MTDLEKVREIRKLFGKEKDKWLTPEELAYVDELCAIATSALERCEDYRQQLLKQGKRLEEARELIEHLAIHDCESWDCDHLYVGETTPTEQCCVPRRARAWLGGE